MKTLSLRQGILEPISAFVKKNKRGIGAEKLKKNVEVQKDFKAKEKIKRVSN